MGMLRLMAAHGQPRQYWVPDNTLTESYAMAQTPTRHPVLLSNLPSDHIVDDPMRLTLVGRMTESPFHNEAYIGDLTDEGRGDPSGTPWTERPRATTAWQFLQEWRHGIWEYASTELGLMQNLVIVSIGFEVASVRHVDFSVVLEDILFVQSTMVELPELVVKRNPPLCPTVPKGDGTATEVDAGVVKEPKLRSALVQLFDFAGIAAP